MKIGILGAGRIGGALGAGWAKAGHEIVFGIRNPDDPKLTPLLAQIGTNARVGTPAVAATFAEIAVLAIPGAAVQETLIGLGDLSAKILVDATNGLGNPTKAGAQMIAEWLPQAKVFKAFNSVGFENLSVPRFGKLQADMFFCGDDENARHLVAQLIEDIDFRPICVGDLSKALMVEMLAGLWGSLAYSQKMGRRLAFKLLSSQDEA